MKKTKEYEEVIENIKQLKDISSKHEHITSEYDKVKLKDFFNQLENTLEFVKDR